MQRALPWAMAIDLSYVGNHGFNRLGALQGGSTVNLNSIDIGTAYLPQNQDQTRAASSVPGATALPANLLRSYKGLANINQNTTEFWDTYHSLQASLNRRFRNGFSFGANYTYGISFKGNFGLPIRYVHNADGTFQPRDDQDEYEKLNETLDRRPHSLKANAVWDLPNVNAMGKVVGAILNDWRLAGVLTAGSGQAYDLGYSYQNNGSNQNLTGSPDFGPRIVYVGDPGSGCSSDQYKSVQRQRRDRSDLQQHPDGVGPQHHAWLRRPPRGHVDLARHPPGRQQAFEFRLDVFNLFDTVIYTGATTPVHYIEPDRSDRPQLADAGGRLERPGAPGAA